MKKLLALAIAAAVAPAFAADNVYVGGDIGRTKAEDVSKTGVGAFVGYTLNENVALEGALRRLGSSDGFSGNAVQFSVLGTLPLTKEINVYGRLGYGRNSLDGKVAGVNTSVSEWKPIVGAGVSYAIDKHISLRGEYSYLGKPLGSKVSQFNFGAAYSF